MTGNAKTWHKIMKRHQDYRTRMIELNLKITEAMTSYLETISESEQFNAESEQFNIRFEDEGIVKLNCEGDLFNLEDIGGFCEVFNLELLINNRTMIENHMEDETVIRTKYLFSTNNKGD